MKLSDYLAEFLAKEGIHHIFEVIGGASVHMVHSIAERKDISYIAVQHEQGGAMAAEAYARLTKNMGAAMATSGPGMTNLITGIACAHFDSIPVIYITGQVNTTESRNGRKVRQVGFQETDIADIVSPITKFSVKLGSAKDIRYVLEKAFYIARSGRPGPVLVDIPMDLQRAMIDEKKLKKFNPSEIKIDVDTKKEVKEKITQAISLIKKSKRPVVIAGGAIRYADQIKEFDEFIKLLTFPVVATWSGIDVVPHDHPLYRGQHGVYGSRGANFAVQNSDCIISIGSRLDTRITGGKPETYAREAKKIVVDIDKAELYKNRGLNPDIGICADVRDVLPIFIDALKKEKIQNITDWLTKTKQLMEKYPKVLPEWRKRNKLVNPYYFIEILSQLLPNNTVTITDCGGNLTWTIQAFHVKKGQRLFSAMGNSPMGYSFPASMGASIALGKKPVICIIGDGGMQINLQELQTMVRYKIPVKVFIINSVSYAIIMQFQQEWFNSKYYGTIPQNGYSAPDFTKIAKAYGLKAIHIDSHKGIENKIKEVLDYKGPIICEVMVPPDSPLIPKLSFGRPIEDQSPLLPRKEFRENMIISPIENL
jgi:acetolactate synthase I/II/III large subunit